jgi:hypothetical protein
MSSNNLIGGVQLLRSAWLMNGVKTTHQGRGSVAGRFGEGVDGGKAQATTYSSAPVLHEATKHTKITKEADHG